MIGAEPVRKQGEIWSVWDKEVWGIVLICCRRFTESSVDPHHCKPGGEEGAGIPMSFCRPEGWEFMDEMRSKFAFSIR